MATPMPRRKRLPLLAVPLIVGACASGPQRGVDRPPDPVPAPRGAALLKAAMIAGHAAARAAAGVPSLIWDETLVASAQQHADEIARTGRYQHAVQPAGVARQGENMWAGMRGVYRYEEMVGLWSIERSDFVDAPAPAFSRSGDWHKVGHYTQMIWRGTTGFGCAMTSDGARDYLVCRYAPAGNVIGRHAI